MLLLFAFILLALIQILLVLDDWSEVRVLESFARSNPLFSVVHKSLVEEVQGLFCHEMLVLLVDEILPRDLLPVLEPLGVVLVDLQAVGVQVLPQSVDPAYFCYFYQLVVVVRALEHRVPLEHHVSQRSAERPDV